MENSAPLRVRKGAWTYEEDELLKKCIEEHGVGNWHKVPSKTGLNRCRKSCRLRWLNYLNPKIKRGNFTSDEVDLIIRLHKLLGNRWSLIAGRLPGRTSNAVKNYWNTHLRNKLFSQREEVDKVKTDKKIKTKVFRPQPHAFSKDLPTTVNNLNLKKNLAQNENPSSNPSLVSSFVADEESWWDKMLLDFENDNENKHTFSFDNPVVEQTKDHWINEETGTSKFASGRFFEEGQLSDWNDGFTKNIGTWDLYDDEQFLY